MSLPVSCTPAPPGIGAMALPSRPATCHTSAVARLLALVALVLLLAGAPAPVQAHADLQQAEPAAGAAVPAPPAELRLRFTEPLDRSATRVEVIDERGQRLATPDPAIGPPNDRLLTVELGGLGEGVYTVRWWSLSQVDGHRWQGVYRFGVGRTPPPDPGAPAVLPSVLELAIQWLALAATSLVLGGAGVPGLGARAGPGPPRRRPEDARPVLARVRWWCSACWRSSASPRRPPATASSPASRRPRPRRSAGIGKAGALALLRLCLVPMIGYLAAPGGSSGMALAFAALLVLTRAQAGHAAGGGLGPVLVDATHQLAGGAWLGGAATFALVVPLLLRERAVAAGPVGVRFGQLALAAAGLAIVSGVASGWVLALDPIRLPASRYGQSLLLKLGLVVLLLGAAFVVWRRRVALAACGSRASRWPPSWSSARACC